MFVIMVLAKASTLCVWAWPSIGDDMSMAIATRAIVNRIFRLMFILTALFGPDRHWNP
ncbi:MAG: hypothetical protein LBL95_09145 [Deltaproteobacteria bacterium]|nr:hypothetical protein [Deltaproteobacteria bacterium]